MLSRSYFWVCLLVTVSSAIFSTSVRAQQTISEARQQLGTEVTVTGTVTRAFGAYARIQDESGSTGASAIVIRQTSGSNSTSFKNDIQSGSIAPGTTLEVTGKPSTFNGLVQINNSDLTSYSIQAQGSLPTAQEVSVSTLQQNGESYESELVRVDGLRFESASGTFENGSTYTVKGPRGEVIEFRVQGDEETAIGGEQVPKAAFAFEGVLGQFNGAGSGANAPDEGYQFIPIKGGDLQPSLSFRFGRLFAIADEEDGAVSVEVQAFNTKGSTVEVTAGLNDASTAENGTDVTGFSSPETLTFSGSDPSPKTLTLTPESDGDKEGVERLEITLSSTDGAVSSPGKFTLWVKDGPAAQAPVAAGSIGDALLEVLRDTYGDPPTLGYDRARDSLYRRIYNDQGTVEAFYSGKQVSVDPNGGDASDQALNQGINTEHVWPRAEGAGNEPALSNLHILVPARKSVNTARSNYPFGEVPDADADRWYFKNQSQSTPPRSAPGDWSELDSSPPDRNDRRFEPRHSKKGDVARAIFYFAMAYPNRAAPNFLPRQRETLLNWHEQDPVDQAELRRTLIAASYQDNSPNPFVLDESLALRAFPVPNETTTNATQPFGDPETATAGSYRLVALAGEVNLPLAATLDGESGIDWQAFWDNGSNQNYLRKHDGSDTFDFRPGSGFWLLSTADWSVNKTVSSVSTTNGNTKIPLHDGWNIISNPLPMDVPWSEVKASNGGMSKVLWSWENGSFGQTSTFTSAKNGKAFYFLNDQGLDQLSIPVSVTTKRSRRASEKKEGKEITLVAEGANATRSRVHVVEHPSAAEGKDKRDVVAPPTRFSSLSLTVEAPFEDAPVRQNRLVRDVRPSAEGHTYTLTLRADTSAPVTLRLASLPSSKETRAVLIHPETGERLHLREQEVVTVPAGTDPTRMRLLVGTAGYVKEQARNPVPETLVVRPPAPNPIRSQAVLRYALPETQNIRIEVYDLLGRKVQTLVNDRQEAGKHRVSWNVQNGNQGLASGMYLIRWSTGSDQHVEKVLLLR